MCGIAGAINYHAFNLVAMQKALLHRGPDEQDIWTEGPIALLHTRLAIQDIQDGHQPMHLGPYVIVFNGEIYNHQVLRESFPADSFRTRSDTETLLHLYARDGIAMLEQLDGMFALALLDRKRNQLILARDRAGKKPLYYTQRNDSFLFASEINALKAATTLAIDEKSIANYVRMGYFFRESTAYENVYALESGTILTIPLESMQLTKQRYFSIESCYRQPKTALSTSDTLIALEEKLERSVQDRLLSSDLEVGAFLSGGIDSSLIVALASRHTDSLKTFTVKFSGAYDESHLAKLTAMRYGTQHTEITINPNLKNDIETILAHYGQPFFDSSAIPSYYVSHEAKQHVTVILNGDGADELFGGYRRYVPFANNWLRMARYGSWLTHLLPTPKEKKSLYNYGYRLLELAGKTDPLEFYLSATTDIWEGYAKQLNHKTNARISDFIQQKLDSDLSSLSQMLWLDFEMLLFGDLLVKMDMATMAHSLEGRSPFLSKYLLEFAPTLADSMKIQGKTTKWILRELGKKLLPSELIHQPKRGFEVPLKTWVAQELKENIYDSLTPGCYAERFIKRSFIDSLLQHSTNVQEEKRAKMLWNLYCLEVWKKSA